MKVQQSIIIFILVFLSSCTTRKSLNYDQNLIAGTYSAKQMENPNGHLNSYNFVHILNRKLLKDTLSDINLNDYKFKIDFTDAKNIDIYIIDGNNKLVSKRKFKYKIENDEVKLRNKNTKALIIPYLAGALDIKKIYLKKDLENNLEVRVKEHRSGGVLLIPLGWSNYTRSEKYRRLE